MDPAHLALRERRANGLPVERAAAGHWASRLVRNPWTWVILGATLVYAGCLAWMYWTSIQDVPVREGTIPGLNPSAIRRAAGLAVPTLLVWLALYLSLDRFRPQRPGLWYLALGWGACVSTAGSMVVNTWAAQEMAITGNGDPTQGARAAVFIAPFVEEALKGTVLFWIAIALRRRLVSKLTGAVLAGLSAAGFAFTENVLYYSRAIVYASTTIEAGDPQAALRGLVFLRGVATAFGHPLFTTLVGLGVIVAVRTRSKVVRVIAPLVGYLAATVLHMAFNFAASVAGDSQQLLYFVVALPLLAVVTFHVLRQIGVEGRRHRHRLSDYVAMGWLPAEVVEPQVRQRTRWRAVLVSMTHGWRTFAATLAWQRALTELVYLRDAMVRGVVDAAGHARERELLERALALRGAAIHDPSSQRARLPDLRRFLRRPRRRAEPVASGAPGGVPLGSPGYSPVDPRWGPPRG